MEFQKERCFIILNEADLKIGNKTFAEYKLLGLKRSLLEYRLPKTIVEKPEKKLKWTDLIIGDVITKGDTISIITQINKNFEDERHIFAGDAWLSDTELEKWEKMEE